MGPIHSNLFSRGIWAALAAAVLAGSARADFASEFFTSEETPADYYTYTPSANGPATVGQWKVTTSFSDTAGWVAVNTVNVPSRLLLHGEAESDGAGVSTVELKFEYTALGDVTLDLEGLRLTKTPGSGEGSFALEILQNGNSLYSYTTTGPKGAHAFSMTTGETLTFWLTVTANAPTSEAYARTTLNVWMQDISGGFVTTPIPEPGSVAAMAGLAVLGFVFWRRRVRA
jgi:PEP-CTERM putative exosortase interaction domain